MLKNFTDCLDLFRNNRKECHQKRFTCSEGFIEFYDTGVKNEVAIYCVFVNQQRSGVFTSFIHELFRDESIARIVVLAVGSHEMSNCLKKIEYLSKKFVDYGGDFVWIR